MKEKADGELDIRFERENPTNVGLRIFELVSKTPKKTSMKNLSEHVEEILSKISVASILDLPLVYESIDLLRRQPNITHALINRYKSLNKKSYDQRMLAIQVIGEIRSNEGVEFLNTVVWQDLPKAEETEAALSARDQEEIIQSKALHGITYLRSSATFKETIRVMMEHPSLHVRVEAIDAYMWNKNDDEKEIKRLYKLLPQEMHKYIERPRFHRNMDPKAFDRGLTIWLEKWGNLDTEKDEDIHEDNVGGR